MRLARLVSPVLAALFTVVTVTSPAHAADSDLTGDLAAHDPALVTGAAGEPWYVFSTGDQSVGGGTIQVRTSDDGRHWTFAGTVWDRIPAWLTEAVPGVTSLWAPEVYRHGGTYYLYYAASTFGSNTSVIALATNATLDPADPAYAWVDRGPVVRSGTGDDFNTIDPAVVEDRRGAPWLAFGSFWSGIRMVQLRWPSGQPASGEMLRLADRRETPNAIEAPYIVRYGGWYYLFTSWGQCCRGTASDYRIVIGRSADVTGPYVDREGRSLLEGGGTTLLATAGNHVGPGGQSISGGTLAYHFYDATAGGKPRLALQQLLWRGDGWPELSPRASTSASSPETPAAAW